MFFVFFFLYNMAGNEKKMEPSVVHQNAIHVETIRKEQRQQKLHTEFSINPHRKRELTLSSSSLRCTAGNTDRHWSTGFIIFILFLARKNSKNKLNTEKKAFICLSCTVTDSPGQTLFLDSSKTHLEAIKLLYIVHSDAFICFLLVFSLVCLFYSFWCFLNLYTSNFF